MDGEDGQNGQNGQNGQDGEDGISPTLSVSTITGGHRLTITDANGTSYFDIMDGSNGTNGTNGTDGVSPTIASSSITGGHRLTITDKNGTSTVDVMDGENGTDGSDGTDGVSPTITSSTITGGHRLTIIDANGTSTVDILDGEQGQTGQTGATGADGYSPTASVSKSGGTATITITDKNGTTTATVSDGAAGTTDYADMTNKPSINSVTLSGNKSLSDLGIHNAPSGGSENQVLAKNSGTDYDFKWVAQSGGDAHGIPSGGTTGQVLAKTNGTDYNVQWKTNSLVNLSDTYIDSVVDGNVLAGSMYGDWRSRALREYMGYFMDIGEGEIALFFDDGNLPGYEPPTGFGGYIINNDSEEQEEYEFLWQHLVTNEYGEYQSTTYWFLCKSQSTPYDLKIKRFTATFDDNTGEWSNLTEQTAPNTHEVSHTWIGTAAEYALLGSYDAHTIYYIKES